MDEDDLDIHRMIDSARYSTYVEENCGRLHIVIGRPDEERFNIADAKFLHQMIRNEDGTFTCIGHEDYPSEEGEGWKGGP